MHDQHDIMFSVLTAYLSPVTQLGTHLRAKKKREELAGALRKMAAKK